MALRKTKIVCTLGPSSDSVNEITKLVEAGMNVARLNFSHGEYSNHQQIINNLRTVEIKTGKRIPILQDLQGPKIRLGILPEEGVKVKEGEKITLTTESVPVGKIEKQKLIPVQYKGIVKVLEPGHAVMIDDGLIELKVISKSGNKVVCKTTNDGLLKSRKGINLPDSKVSIPTITPKDKKDLIFGLKNDVDFVALSFVRNRNDIKDLRKLIKKSGKDSKIIAKIERFEAIQHLASIIQEADGVMVARGDLGVEIPPEQVPVVQKKMIALANQYGKPVITATQVLQSMVKNSRATRAEISDAANAVYDHTDAIMLSNESAVGKYPAEAAETLAKVALVVEKELEKHYKLESETWVKKYISPKNSTYLNACEMAADIKADCIINYSPDGYSAEQISKYRPPTPIITLTDSEKNARWLSLVWGLNTVYTMPTPTGKNPTEKIIDFLKEKKAIKSGQKIIIVCDGIKKSTSITTVTI